MKFTTIKCPNCDADLKIEKGTQICECDYCHRKYMGWELSHGQAEYLAEKIVKAMEDF